MPALGPDDRQHQRHRRHGLHRIPVAGQARGTGSGVRARWCRCRPTATPSSATRTGAWVRRSSCCTSSMASPWVYGVLVNNIWSLTSNKQGGSYNNGLIQPFVNYNFEGGFYLTSAPIADRRLEGRQRPAVDGAAGRRRRQDLPPRQAAGEHAAVGVLQRGEAGLRRELADSRAGAVHVPEVDRAREHISDESHERMSFHGLRVAVCTGGMPDDPTGHRRQPASAVSVATRRAQFEMTARARPGGVVQRAGAADPPVSRDATGSSTPSGSPRCNQRATLSGHLRRGRRSGCFAAGARNENVRRRAENRVVVEVITFAICLLSFPALVDVRAAAPRFRPTPGRATSASPTPPCWSTSRRSTSGTTTRSTSARRWRSSRTGAKDETFGVIFATRAHAGRQGRAHGRLREPEDHEDRLPDAARPRRRLRRRAADRSSRTDVRTISLDRLEASLALAGIKPPTVAVQNNPPQVIVSYSPAILVPIDGAPVLKPVPGHSRFQRVDQHRALILQGGLGRQLLHPRLRRLADRRARSPGRGRRRTLGPFGMRADARADARRRPARSTCSTAAPRPTRSRRSPTACRRSTRARCRPS